MNTEANQFLPEGASGFSAQAKTKVLVFTSNHHLHAVFDAGGLITSIDCEGPESAGQPLWPDGWTKQPSSLQLPSVKGQCNTSS